MAGTFKKLVCVAPEKLEWQELPVQHPGPDEVLIKNDFAAAKHGTEMSFYKGYGARRGSWDGKRQIFVQSTSPAPAPHAEGLGNMAVGTVIEAGGGVTALKAGDRVISYSGFSEQAVRKADCNFDTCWKVPKDVPWQSAVCADPADFAVAACRDGEVRVGDAVAVFAMGAIGLVAVQIAKLSGAYPIIAVDLFEKRLNAARTLGADAVLKPNECDVGAELKKLTGNRGVDVAIEYSGSVPALQAAIRGAAYGGTVVCGAYPPPYGAGLDFGGEAHMNTPRIVFSRSCSEPNRDHPRWTHNRIYETGWRLICEGRIDGTKIVDPVVPFAELLVEYPKIATHPAENIKLGARF